MGGRDHVDLDVYDDIPVEVVINNHFVVVGRD